MEARKRKEKSGPLWIPLERNLLRNRDNGTIHARFRVKGKTNPTWRSLGTDKITIARVKLAEVMKAERRLKERGDGKITLRQALEVHMERLSAKPKTVKYHRQRINRLLGNAPDPEKTGIVKTKRQKMAATWPTSPDIQISKITVDDCHRWAKSHRQFSASNFNATRTILKDAIAIGIEQGARDDSPIDKIKREKPAPKVPNIPSHEQFQQFLHAIETSGSGWAIACANLVRFLAYSGARIDEAVNVTWGDVDFESGMITFRGGEDGLKAREVGEVRNAPMIPPLVKLLRDLKRAEGAVSPGARIMQVKTCQGAMDSAAEKVGIPRITHHVLRHVFGSYSINAGVDIPTVAEWLGHKDGGALLMRTYSHVIKEHSKSMAQKVTFGMEAAA